MIVHNIITFAFLWNNSREVRLLQLCHLYYINERQIRELDIIPHSQFQYSINSIIQPSSMSANNPFQRYLDSKKFRSSCDDDDSDIQIQVLPKKTQKQTKMDIFLTRNTQKQDSHQNQISIHHQPIQQDMDQLFNKTSALDRSTHNPLGKHTFRKEQPSANLLKPLNEEMKIISSQTQQIQAQKVQPKYKAPIYEFYQDSNIKKSFSYHNSVRNDFRPDLCYSYQLPEYNRRQRQSFSNYQPTLQMLKAKGKEERRAKKLKQKEQKKALAQKKRKQYEQQKKQGFSAFMDFVLVDKDKKENNNQQIEINNDEGLKNLCLYNNMLQENEERQSDNIRKMNAGLIYRKKALQKQKIPNAFLRIILSYKFSKNFLIPEKKKVPNSFSDQMIYKKIFHYLVTNQCLADIHLRMKKIEENPSQNTLIPIQLLNYSKNSEGLIQVIMREIPNRSKQDEERESFMLKNLWMSKNRIGIITNEPNLKIENYGIYSDKDRHHFSFLCLLQSPQNKEQLQGNVRALASFQVSELGMIVRVDQSPKAYFHDLEKISTHIRQYLAITHLYDTQLAPLIYNPQLIDKKHYEVLNENDRHKLEPILSCLSNKFNQTQYSSIRQMVIRDEGIVLLQGPPGTGKTTTLMGLLAAEYHYLKFICDSGQKNKILICAPSNAAINHITKRLVCEGLLSVDGCQVFPNILRVGIVETEDADIRSVSIDDICDKKVLEAKESINKKNNMTSTEIRQKIIRISKEINQLQNQQKRHPNPDNQNKINQLKKQSKSYESKLYNFRKQKIQSKQIYLDQQKKLFDEADIILTTLSSSGSEKMEKLTGYIGCLIIDEAAQSTQPNLLIPFQSFAKKVLLIGDPCQLPATTMSQDSQITLFNRSLFQRFIDAGVKPYFLNIQYRMAPPIREFASNCFYQGRLVDAQQVINRYQKQILQNDNLDSRNIEGMMSPLIKISQFVQRNYYFIDAKSGYEEFSSNSYRNVEESSVTSYFIWKFLKNTKLSIGVITPYQAQRKYIQNRLLKDIENEKKKVRFEASKGEKTYGTTQLLPKNQGKHFQRHDQKEAQSKQLQLQEDKYAEKFLDRIMINTVDSFQGQEKDIIIVSTVRANKRRDIGFMKDQRRINVALTRSKHLLIVIGHGDTLGSNQIWDKLLSWHEQRKTYYSIQNHDEIRKLYDDMYYGKYPRKVERERYNNLSKDLRKLQRNQIKSSDFGLGMPKKKQKIDQRSIPKNQDVNMKQGIESTTSNVVIEKASNNLLRSADCNDNQQKWLQQKIEQQNEAVKLQQMNKRLKELQQKMATENSAFAQLFK